MVKLVRESVSTATAGSRRARRTWGSKLDTQFGGVDGSVVARSFLPGVASGIGEVEALLRELQTNATGRLVAVGFGVIAVGATEGVRCRRSAA